MDSSFDFFVAGSDNNNCYLFSNSIVIFYHKLLHQASDDIEVVDITENGQKILIIDVSG